MGNCGITYSPLGLVDNSAKPYIVGSVVYNGKVSNSITDFLTVVELMTTENRVRNTHTNKGVFNCVRLCVCTVKHGKIVKALTACNTVKHGVGNIPCLRLLIVGSVEYDFSAFAVICPEVFTLAL